MPRFLPRTAAQGALCATLVLCTAAARAQNTGPTVAELFTSQGCSSCPPADAVAGRLRADPKVIVLSFHVNYWDGPQWRDPFASAESTERQYLYSRVLAEHSVFTPQLVLNGTLSLVGSEEPLIRRAIAATNAVALPVRVEVSRLPVGFMATFAGAAMKADVWEVEFVQHSSTRIRGGENGGRTLETYDNVIRFHRLGAFSPGAVQLPGLQSPADGLAILVQAPGLGRMLGAGVYELR